MWSCTYEGLAMEHVYLTLQEITKAREVNQITKSEEAELLKRINVKKRKKKEWRGGRDSNSRPPA